MLPDEQRQLGITTVDRLHRMLADAISGMARASADAGFSLQDHLMAFSRLALRHLQLEEDLLRRIDGSEASKRKHRLSQARVFRLLSDHLTPDPSKTDATLAIQGFSDWLTAHFDDHVVLSQDVPGSSGVDFVSRSDPQADDSGLDHELMLEAALRESEVRLSLVLERTGTGIWDWDFESNRVRFSRSWYTMLGFQPSDFPEALETWENLVHPDDLPGAQAAVGTMKASIHQHEPYDTVFRMRTQDGRWRWINSRAVVVRRDAAGHPTRVLGTHIDLTERMKVDATLHEQQEKLAGLFRAAPIGIAMTLDRSVLEVNETFCRLTGYSRAELIGKNTRMLYGDRAEYERIGAIKDRCMGLPDSVEADTRWHRRDGRIIDVLLSITPRDRKDPLKGLILTVLDVTARKSAEAALAASEARYALAMEATQDGMWDWDVVSGEVTFSPGWCRMLGENQLSPVYESWAERVHPEDWPTVERALAAHLRGVGDVFEQEQRLRTAGGDWLWVLGRGRVVARDSSGLALRMVGTATDISARKKAEAAVQQLLQSKDQFIAMLGHELRNPLAPIRSATEMLGRIAGDDPDLCWLQQLLDRHVGQLSRIVDDLLEVSRLQRGKIALQVEDLEVHRLMDQLGDSARSRLVGREMTFRVAMPAEPLCLHGDALRLTQVFDALIDNAIRYTPDGGEILFSAAREGRFAVFRLRDTGAGIAPELLPRIFEPFAQGARSLDRSEGGLGLGLTVARELISLHRGHLDVASEGEGKGSEFIVRLPLDPIDSFDAKSGLVAPLRHRPDSRMQRSVLVVDDNSDAAQSLALLLDYYGHEVRTAADGPEAIEISRSFGPSVVLMDIGLPGMNGFALAQALRAQSGSRQPRIVAVTGYGQTEYRNRAKRAGFDDYLVKPVRLDDIRWLFDSMGGTDGDVPKKPADPSRDRSTERD